VLVNICAILAVTGLPGAAARGETTGWKILTEGADR